MSQRNEPRRGFFVWTGAGGVFALCFAVSDDGPTHIEDRRGD